MKSFAQLSAKADDQRKPGEKDVPQMREYSVSCGLSFSLSLSETHILSEPCPITLAYKQRDLMFLDHPLNQRFQTVGYSQQTPVKKVKEPRT